jgi:hypothetical protein
MAGAGAAVLETSTQPPWPRSSFSGVAEVFFGLPRLSMAIMVPSS